MGYGWDDLFLDVATGGGYTVTNTLTEKTIENTIENAKRVREESGELFDDISDWFAPRGSATQMECCPPYQLVGEFLLETNTGRVWRYDAAEETFVEVQKKVSPTVFRILEGKFEEARLTLRESISDNLGSLPRAMPDEELEQLLDAQSGFMLKELKRLKPLE